MLGGCQSTKRNKKTPTSIDQNQWYLLLQMLESTTLSWVGFTDVKADQADRDHMTSDRLALNADLWCGPYGENTNLDQLIQ